jgi:hypothetical protein
VVSRRAYVTAILKSVDLFVIAVTFMMTMGFVLRGPNVNEWAEVLQLRVSVQNAIFFSIYMMGWHVVLSSV